MKSSPLQTFLIIFPIIIVLGVIFFVQINRKAKEEINAKVPTVTIQPSTEEPLVGGDKDMHGCIGSAGYSWCEVKQKCLRPWEEPCEIDVSDSQTIKAALVEKNNWSSEEIKITISRNDGQYAMGGVSNEASEDGGGLWFATKINNEWKIVYDGNGVITCEQLFNYPEFPTDLIPECYDPSTESIIKR